MLACLGFYACGELLTLTGLSQATESSKKKSETYRLEEMSLDSKAGRQAVRANRPVQTL